MRTYTDLLPFISGSEYEAHFWNAVRGKSVPKEQMAKGYNTAIGGYAMTPKMQSKLMDAIRNESLLRGMATEIQAYNGSSRIKAAANDGMSVWVPEGGIIPMEDGMADFSDIRLDTHKLAAFVTLEEDFAHDSTFKIEEHLIQRLARNFGRGEDKAFITGTGVNMPTGILADEDGADIGVEADQLTYDDVVKLFFSVKPEYRRNGTWLMNDETALALRTLKDDAGNYIWNHANDTILGHKVRISEFMPNAETGSKPIAFGDFRYYWIVDKRPVCLRTLVEKFVLLGCVGYLAYEFLDGKLVRPEAVKVMRIN